MAGLRVENFIWRNEEAERVNRDGRFVMPFFGPKHVIMGAVDDFAEADNHVIKPRGATPMLC